MIKLSRRDALRLLGAFTVTTPLQKAGAYLLTATMDDSSTD